MARVVAGARRGAIDPVKLGQPLGAVLAFLGLNRSMPLVHGSQGCSASAKALLTRHFREPIPLQTSAVTEVSAVLGAGSNLLAAIESVTERTRPDVIGVLTTGLVEISGEDLPGLVNRYEAGWDGTGPLVIGVNTPDFTGGMSRGWANAVEAVVSAGARLADAGHGPAEGVRHDRVLPVLTGVSLTATDLDQIADLVRAFGLLPLLVPDLSGSLDGHLADEWSSLTTGGTPRQMLPLLGTARSAQAIGVTARQAGDVLAGRGAEVDTHAHLSGLAAVDTFVDALRQHTDGQVPESVLRSRSRFTDTLLDAHFVLDGARLAVAGEPELLAAVTTLATSVGAEIVAAVSPTPDPVLQTLPCEDVVIGDLADLSDRAAEAGAEMLIGNGHLRRIADRIGATHLPLGLPVTERLGTALATVAGYHGGQRFLTEAANRLLDHRDRRHDAPGPSTTVLPSEESLC
jgi:nitrogenase molybdenum-iron protein NifN